MNNLRPITATATLLLMPLFMSALQGTDFYDTLNRLLIEPDNSTAYVEYISHDLNGDSIDDLIIANADRSRYLAFSVSNGLSPITLTAQQHAEVVVPATEHNEWISLRYLPTQFPVADDDITTSQLPLFVSDADIYQNVYSCWYESQSVKPALGQYNRIVFKPHVGKVRFIRQESCAKGDSEEEIQINCADFALIDPSQAKRMFRGYSNNEVAPVIVTEAFLATHTPLQFSRWKEPEPRRAMSRDAEQIVCHHYAGNNGPMRVLRSQWLATLPTEVGNRDYYEVVLVGKRVMVFGMVCLAEGAVAAAAESVYHTDFDINDTTIKNLDFYNDDIDALFSDHLPEIMCIMATDKGLELYLRYNSMEGTHYSVYREVGTRLMDIIDEYHYWFY